MKNSLALLLATVMAMPSYSLAEVTNINDSLQAYIAAQRQMIADMRLHPDDAAKLNNELKGIQRSYQINFGNIADSTIANRLQAYQRSFHTVVTDLRENGEWGGRRENAWKKAEAVSPSPAVLQWAQQDVERREAEDSRLAAEAAKVRFEKAMADQIKKQEEADRQARIKAELERREATAQAAEAEKKALRERQAQIEKEQEEAIAAARQRAQEQRDQVRSEHQRKIEDIRTAGRAPIAGPQSDEEYTVAQLTRPESDEEFTRTQLAAADRRDAEQAAKVEAERVAAATAAAAAPRLATSPFTVTGNEYLDESIRRRAVEENMERPAIFNSALAQAKARAGTTAAGSTRREDAPVASPISAPAGLRIPPSAHDAAPGLTQAQIYAEIKKIAKSSGCIGARHRQHVVTENFLNGMAFSFARSMCRPVNDPIRTSMTGVSRAVQVASLEGVQIPSDEANLKNIYRLLMGLGLTESNGNFAEGRDRSVSNTNGISTEAGPFQTSYDIKGCLGRHWNSAAAIQREYTQAGPQACLQSELLKGRQSSYYGRGAALEFQRFLRTCPVGAIEHAAVTAKNCSRHYGPLKRGTASPVPRCNKVFDKVAEFMNKNRAANCQSIAINGGSGSQVASRSAAGRQ